MEVFQRDPWHRAWMSSTWCVTCTCWPHSAWEKSREIRKQNRWSSQHHKISQTLLWITLCFTTTGRKPEKNWKSSEFFLDSKLFMSVITFTCSYSVLLYVNDVNDVNDVNVLWGTATAFTSSSLPRLHTAMPKFVPLPWSTSQHPFGSTATVSLTLQSTTAWVSWRRSWRCLRPNHIPKYSAWDNSYVGVSGEEMWCMLFPKAQTAKSCLIMWD